MGDVMLEATSHDDHERTFHSLNFEVTRAAVVRCKRGDAPLNRTEADNVLDQIQIGLDMEEVAERISVVREKTGRRRASQAGKLGDYDAQLEELEKGQWSRNRVRTPAPPPPVKSWWRSCFGDIKQAWQPVEPAAATTPPKC